MSDDEVLLDVADAVGSNQAVDWRRCAGQLTVANRVALDNLRTLSPLFSARGDSTATGAAASSSELESASSRLVLRAIWLLAALLVGVALTRVVLVPGALSGPFAIPQVLVALSFTSCAWFLCVGGRGDRRARLLGAMFGLVATSFVRPFGPPWLGAFYPEVFQPALMWSFAREFPIVYRRSRVDALARRMVIVCALLGAVLWAASLSPLAQVAPLLGRDHVSNVYWTLLSVLTLGGLGTLVLRTRYAPSEEVRRVRVFIGSLVLGVAPMTIDIVLESAVPAARELGDQWRGLVATIVFGFLLSTPLAASYAVLSRGVLDIRWVLRDTYQRLLTRRLLATLTVAPLLAWPPSWSGTQGVQWVPYWAILWCEAWVSPPSRRAWPASGNGASCVASTPGCIPKPRTTERSWRRPARRWARRMTCAASSMSCPKPRRAAVGRRRKSCFLLLPPLASLALAVSMAR